VVAEPEGGTKIVRVLDVGDGKMRISMPLAVLIQVVVVLVTATTSLAVAGAGVKRDLQSLTESVGEQKSFQRETSKTMVEIQTRLGRLETSLEFLRDRMAEVEARNGARDARGKTERANRQVPQQPLMDGGRP
jgi:hypothetical protein